MKKLTSLSIFFPFFNDEKTVKKQIGEAYTYGKQVTDHLEVIAIHGGNSIDKTFEKILDQKKVYPQLKIINKPKNNEGYAVIKYGFYVATKDWVFYTDGDSQYHLDELKKLVTHQEKTHADVINGYKSERQDSLIRKILGSFYNNLLHVFYELPISDIDCDFRLIRKMYVKKIQLNSTSGAICLELILKLKKAGAKFSQIEVSHYARIYGKSSFFRLTSILRSLQENVLFFLDKM